VAISLFQKLRLTLRVWNRRRAEARQRRDEDFLRRNARWGAAATTSTRPATATTPTGRTIDLEGLQVAFLDDSGQIIHFLDLTTGEVVDMAPDGPSLAELHAQPDRYKRVPARGAESEAADRRDFAGTLQPPSTRQQLQRSIDTPAEFRRAVARDRALERAWYSFKNDRALAAIEHWLSEILPPD
jgi:Uncharacterised protein family (UPF0158)